MIECRKCVLTSEIEDIEFDDDGVCSYCRKIEIEISRYDVSDKSQKLELIFNEIRNKSNSSEYDCIIGVSGGVDSSYLVYLAVENGINPLLVHVDTGWNTKESVSNINKIVNKYDLDLYTHVIDWNEMAKLQEAFFAYKILDCDIPQDHVFPPVLHMLASKFGIKSILSGHNIWTEFTLPRNWSMNSDDKMFISSVFESYTGEKLKKYPTYSKLKKFYYKKIKNIKDYRPLYFVDYNQFSVQEILKDEFDWKDYGGKHFESKLTKYFQSYYLYNYFGIDKRKAHLSNLIQTGQIEKEDALEILKEKPYDESIVNNEKFVADKLGYSVEGFRKLIGSKTLSSAIKSDFDTIFYKLYRKFS
ncbi:N-acetyl sugar amidotransferase [Vibrio sp. 10N.261.55.A7]|uniref:N-acetyl sugar amidotransferase n=1 Tax=Vibrio sp. 10N.261.55.A7 TaxID=1880851 RepID=UPI000C864DDA|nr:N-acetyl sugar amidotransferase [Vibrio sp. 10N.261.55.A7]PMK05029.1 hypothetical protein BCU12_02060 [Vibrio sp. 10N.261.55.A7]